MKIELELFEDCSDYEQENPDTAHWILKLNGVQIAELDTYQNIHKKLDVLFGVQENFELKKRP